MSSPYTLRGLLLLGLSFTSAACIAAPPVADEDAADDEDAVTTELSAKTTGITVWSDPIARPIVRYGANGWLVEGRASKNLSAVFSFSSDDEFGEATLVSARKFEIFVDETSMERLMRGYHLFLEITPATGSQPKYFASFD